MLTNQKRLHQLLKISQPSTKQREQMVKLLRSGRYDLPECVFEHSYALLKDNSSSQQRYHLANDLILSGLELKIGAKLKGYLQKFKEALGQVPYASRLAALVDYVISSQPSDSHFNTIIKANAADYDSKKQAIGVIKAHYEWDDYVAKLNEYLKENPNDTEAWMELGDVYAEKSQYLRALFCYEEVVILTPDNDYYFLRLAELYYTDGGKQNLAIAVKYFSYVVSRNPNNVRALWGLYRTLYSQKDSLDEHDHQKSKDAIHKIYSKKNPDLKIHLAF